MWGTQVLSLGWEDPLEKEMATHFSTLAWKIPWLEESGRLESMGSQRVGRNWATSLSLFHFLQHYIHYNEGSMHPHLQACLRKDLLPISLKLMTKFKLLAASQCLFVCLMVVGLAAYPCRASRDHALTTIVQLASSEQQGDLFFWVLN